MTSYLKIFVLIDFHFQDAIFPFNRAAPYGMTSAVPREQGRTSARSAERPLALDPRPHSSAAARASLRFLVRSATERRTSRGEISFQLPFKRYPIKNFGSNRADKSENFPLRGVHTCLKSRIPSKVRRYRIPSKVEYNVEWPTLLFVIWSISRPEFNNASSNEKEHPIAKAIKLSFQYSLIFRTVVTKFPFL